MNLLDLIASDQNGAAVNQLASRFGLAPEQATSAVAALLPALTAGLQRNASSESGLSSLISAVTSGRHSAYLDDPSTLSKPDATTDGNAILGHILGSKDVSRQLAANASQSTGDDCASVMRCRTTPTSALLFRGRSLTASRAISRSGRGRARE